MNDIVPFHDDEIKIHLTAGFDHDLLAKYDPNVPIVDEASAKQALSMSLQARKMKNQVEESRKEIVRPHIDFQKAVMKFAKDLNEKFEDIETTLHIKIAEWMKTQKDNPFTIVDELKVDDGTLTCKTNWVFEVQESTAVPREYLMPDEDKIKRAIANGIRNIPGVRIYSYESTHMRVKN